MRSVVVGAGPNGLTAAVDLARAGADVLLLERNATVGGGSRSAELTAPGIVHDVCAAVHAFGPASPAFARLGLERHGVRWLRPPIALAHPLDDGTAALLHEDLDRTAEGLGRDGRAWRTLFGPAVRRAEGVFDEVLRPVLHVPRDLPALLAMAPSVLPATALARAVFRTEPARALFAGMAAHAFLPLERPLTAAFGLGLGVAGHVHGWPVAEGGSQAIPDALARLFVAAGGEVRTGTEVTALAEVGELAGSQVDATVLDVTPRQLARLAGDRLPPRARRRAARWRLGPAVWKVDYAVRGGVPWTCEAVGRAGTVHLGGTMDEVAAMEADTFAGRLARRPFVLVAQQHVADPSRADGDLVPIWAYAHVPTGFDGDATALVDAQVERFAPGFLDRVEDRHVMGPAAYEAYNPNVVAGDISGGAHDGLQFVARPRVALDPYRTAIDDVWLCSSSTPPGGGVHGMCGANAAASVLAALT